MPPVASPVSPGHMPCQHVWWHQRDIAESRHHRHAEPVDSFPGSRNPGHAVSNAQPSPYSYRRNPFCYHPSGLFLTGKENVPEDRDRAHSLYYHLTCANLFFSGVQRHFRTFSPFHYFGPSSLGRVYSPLRIKTMDNVTKDSCEAILSQRTNDF